MSREKKTVTGIECPRCGHGTRVSVTINFASFLRRQRVCKNIDCGYSFYTTERIVNREALKREPDRKD